MKILENVDLVKLHVELDGKELRYGLRFNNFPGQRNIMPVSETMTIKDVIDNADLILNHLELCERLMQ